MKMTSGLRFLRPHKALILAKNVLYNKNMIEIAAEQLPFGSLIFPRYESQGLS